VDYQPFPQPKSLSATLLERQLVLLGSLLATVSEANQVQILDVMLAAATMAPPKIRGKDSPLRREAVLTSICCTALAGLDTLACKYQGSHHPSPAVGVHSLGELGGCVPQKGIGGSCQHGAGDVHV